MRFRSILFVCVGIGIIAFLIYRMGYRDILKTFSLFSWQIVFATFLFYLFNLFVGAIKFMALFSPLKKLGFTLAFRYYTMTWSFALLTSGKMGDVALTFFLRPVGLETGQRFAFAFINRILSLLGAFSFAFLGAWFLYFQEYLFSLVFISLFLLGILAIALSSFSRRLISTLLVRFFSFRVSGFYRTVIFFARKHPHILFFNFLLSLVESGLVTFSLVKILFVYLGLNVPFMTIAAVVSISRVLSFIPITFSGIGIREASAVYFFSKAGVAPEVSFSVYLFMLITSYILVLFFFFIYRSEFISFTHHKGK